MQFHRSLTTLVCLLAGLNTPVLAENSSTKLNTPAGMIWLEGGVFKMGSDLPMARADEKPVHAVKLDSFWIDANEVTNAEFKRFVEATGYITTAEKSPVLAELMQQLPAGSPEPAPELLKPGALVFSMDKHRWDWA